MHGSSSQTNRLPPEGGAKIAVSVNGVSKSFGDLEVVSQASFDVRAGTIRGLVGSDGAGKTTLLRIIATMIPPSTGTVLIHGLDVVRQRAAIKEIIGYMPQRFGLYPDLTVKENMTFFMDIYGISGSERQKKMEEYLGFANLLPFLDRRAGNLSGGMKQKLGLACVLVHEPQVLILDEPTNGVDPVSRQEFWDMILEMKRRGKTIIVSTAYLDEGEKCDSIILMHRSRILADSSPEEFKAGYPSLEEAIIAVIEKVDQG